MSMCAGHPPRVDVLPTSVKSCQAVDIRYFHHHNPAVFKPSSMLLELSCGIFVCSRGAGLDMLGATRHIPLRLDARGQGMQPRLLLLLVTTLLGASQAANADAIYAEPVESGGDVQITAAECNA
eukprot:jgi/Ulvmu1/8830/UM049_0010.1